MLGYQESVNHKALAHPELDFALAFCEKYILKM